MVWQFAGAGGFVAGAVATLIWCNSQVQNAQGKQAIAEGTITVANTVQEGKTDQAKRDAKDAQDLLDYWKKRADKPAEIVYEQIPVDPVVVSAGVRECPGPVSSERTESGSEGSAVEPVQPGSPETERQMGGLRGRHFCAPKPQWVEWSKWVTENTLGHKVLSELMRKNEGKKGIHYNLTD